MNAYNYNQWNNSGQVSGGNAPLAAGNYAPVGASYQAAPESLNSNQPYYQTANAKYLTGPQANNLNYGVGGAPAPTASSGPQRVNAPSYNSGLFPSANPYQGQPAYNTGTPAPIGTKPEPPRGPFEAVTREPSSGASWRPSSNIGSGGPKFRSQRPLLTEPGGHNMRSQAPRPLMELSDDWGTPPNGWKGGPRPNRWEGPQTNRWNGSRGGAKRGKWQDRPMVGQQTGRGGGATGDRQTSRPLMSFDFDKKKDNQSRKRHLSDLTPDIHSKRHVDEDLNVTIATGRSSEEKERHCAICNVKIKKGYELQQHLRGRRHKQKVAEQKAAGVASSNLAGEAADTDISLADTLTLMPLDDPEKLKFYCIICRLSLLTELNKKAHDCTPSHLKRVQEIAMLEKNKKEGMKVCQMCVATYKACEEDAHMQSDGHQEALHWRMASCEICTCKFNDTVELKKHLQLARHQKQLEKLKQNGLTHEKMKIYFENVQAAIQEKRLSFCLICTTACGNVENLEIHNAVAGQYHDEMKSLASKAKENQFYCFCCKKVVDESERRAHGKSMRHKQNKEMNRSWDCADCSMTFDEERKLYPHLKCRSHATQVERRKAIQRQTANKCMQEWRDKQTEANKVVQEQLARISEDCVQEQEGAGQDGPFDADVKVMPVTGHYCMNCKVFYQFDAGRENLCVHVKEFKGMKVKDNEEPDEEADTNGSNCEERNGEKTEAGVMDGEDEQEVADMCGETTVKEEMRTEGEGLVESEGGNAVEDDDLEEQTGGENSGENAVDHLRENVGEDNSKEYTEEGNPRKEDESGISQERDGVDASGDE